MICYSGTFDDIHQRFARGWAYNALEPDTRIPLEIWIDGVKWRRVDADLFREDLLKNGVGDGRHGFSIRLPKMVFDGAEHILGVHVADSQQELNNSPQNYCAEKQSVSALKWVDYRDYSRLLLANLIRTPQQNQQLAVEEQVDGKIRLSALPVLVTVDTTSVCNLKCVMCPHGIMEIEKKHLAPELFSRTLPFIPFACEIQLYGLGEPLTSSSFWNCAKAGVYHPETLVVINSNALLLNERCATRLLDSAIGVVNFSMDAATETSYHKIRGGDWGLVIENIERFRKMRDARGKCSPLIYLNMLIMRENFSEINGFVKIAHDIGVDGILLRGLNRYSDEEMSRYVVRRKDWVFDYKEQGLWDNRALYEEEILRARKLADQYGLRWVDRDTEEVGFFRVMDNHRLKSESAPQSSMQGIKECGYPWEWLMINIDGNVRPCCYAKKFIGNLYEMSSDEIWNGVAMQEVRRKILAGEIPELCRGADCKFVNIEKLKQ